MVRVFVHAGREKVTSCSWVRFLFLPQFTSKGELTLAVASASTTHGLGAKSSGAISSSRYFA